MFIGDKTKKTVRIIVRVKAGGFARADGTALPKIKEETLADLVLPADQLVDEAERRKLEEETHKELLSAGSVVFVGFSRGMMKGKVRGLVRPQDLKTWYGYGYLFAEVRLQEPLVLRMRGDKEPVLEDCNCSIPMLNAEAQSLNHAFTVLSTKFETKRISHTGNVFARVFYYHEKSKDWHPLNELRGHIEHLMPNPNT